MIQSFVFNMYLCYADNITLPTKESMGMRLIKTACA